MQKPSYSDVMYDTDSLALVYVFEDDFSQWYPVLTVGNVCQLSKTNRHKNRYSWGRKERGSERGEGDEWDVGQIKGIHVQN